MILATDPISELRPFDKLPPHSVESEMCVIGSLMMTGGQGAAFTETREELTPEMFFQADHSILFKVICDISDKGSTFDAMTVRNELIKRDILEEIGGIEYIANILSSVPNAANGPHYAKTVREMWAKRELISAATDIQRKCYEANASDEHSSDIAQWALTRMGSLLGGGKASDVVHIGEMLQQVYASIEVGGKGFVKTGFFDFDELTGGVELGEMLVIAARPSMGKSIIGRQIAHNSARFNSVPTLFISREEGVIKMGRNILSMTCEIDNNRLRKAKDLKEQDWLEIGRGVANNSDIPLWINKTAGTPQQIRALVSMMIEKHGIKLVVIDYLQRVQGKGMTPYERVSNVSTSLADMFHELPVAGIVLAQLSRANLARPDKRPNMGDVRESGAIEQDADGLVFLHREDYYHLDDNVYQPTGIAELIIEKWRDSVRNKIVKLKSNLRYQRFENMLNATGQEDPF